MSKQQLYYCKRCGRTVRHYTENEEKCDFCRNTIQLVPEEYLHDKVKVMLDPERKQEFMDKYIKPSPEFDPELHKKLKHWLDTRWDKPSKKPGNPYGIECPYCHSTDIQRIQGVTLTVFTDVSAVGKQFQCRYCSAYF